MYNDSSWQFYLYYIQEALYPVIGNTPLLVFLYWIQNWQNEHVIRSADKYEIVFIVF